MKVHVFISVLAFHVVVIAGLYLLSACSSSSGPTAADTSPSSTGGSIYDSYAQPNRPVEDDNLVVTEVNTPQQGTQLDPAFNTGSDAYNVPSPNRGGERSAPRRPGDSGYANQATPEINPMLNEEMLTPLVDATLTSPAIEYVVAKGDSLWKISRDFGVSLNDLLQANGLTQNSTINAGQSLVIPSESGAASSVAAPSYSAAPTTTSESYTVVKGDSLSKIARKFNTTVSAIKSANGLRSDVIQLNQNLTIPVNSRSSTTASSVPQPTVAPTSTYSAPTPQTSGSDFDGIVHVIASGENPSTIARKYGITTAQLMKDNGISDARKIRVGQKLKIFLGVAQPAAAPTTPPPSTQPASRPVSTPTLFDDSVFNSLDDIPELEVVPQD
jgi:LysM repeat protein